MRLSSAALLASLLSACSPASAPPPAAAANAATTSPGSSSDNDGPAWVVRAIDAGEAPPAVGRSLFDYLVTDPRAVQSVPFPFTALVQDLETTLGDSDGRMLEQVLIPIGRSLQRNAANPHFFNYPRVVLAVVGEGGAPQPEESGMLLKDRLYIGYQERANAMEVISYNEAAGRFEFEIVSDYRPGGKAQVRYVDRSNCLPCHQNHAPIFSRPPWDETNANTAVADRLRAVQDHFYGVPVAEGIDVPNAIDDATDRANLLSAYQRIWAEACGPTTDTHSTHCRGDALLSVLRYRLSGLRHPAPGSDAARTALTAALQRHWPQLWPQGLAVPDADIPNRELGLRLQNNDLMDLPAALRANRSLTTEETIAIAQVPKALEPFTPRAPRDVWRSDALDDRLVDGLVNGLASFLATADVRRLDEQLYATRRHEARARGAPMSCTLTPGSAGADGALTIEVACRASNAPADASASPDLDATLSLAAGGTAVSGLLRRLELPGPEMLHDLEIARSPLHHEGTHWRAQLELREATAGLHARLSDGNALEPIELAWEQGSAGPMHGEARIRVSEDFAPVTAAVGLMVKNAAAGGSDALGAAPFRRVALLRDLFAELKMEPLVWCCLDTQGMPPAMRGEIVVPGATALPP